MSRELLYLRCPVSGEITVHKLNGRLYEPIATFADKEAFNFFVQSGAGFVELLDRLDEQPDRLDEQPVMKFMPAYLKAVDLSNVPAGFLDAEDDW